jgi:hypothetical protein
MLFPNQRCTAMMLVFARVVILLVSVLTGIEAFTTTSTTATSSTNILSAVSWRSTTVKSNNKNELDVAPEQVHVGSSRQSATRLQQLVHQKSDTESNKKKDCYMPCANLFDTNDNDDESRREALFSMVGALWAVTGASIVVSSPPIIEPAHDNA